MYSYLLKRRSQLNIILGGLCGGTPPLVGWVAVTTADLWTMGMVLAGLVFVWIPLHIWSLTMRYRDDYNRVDVPMLTAVRSESTSARVIAASTLAMVAFSLVPLFLTVGGAPASGMVYAVTALASGALMVAISGWVVARPHGAGRLDAIQVLQPVPGRALHRHNGGHGPVGYARALPAAHALARGVGLRYTQPFGPVLSNRESRGGGGVGQTPSQGGKPHYLYGSIHDAGHHQVRARTRPEDLHVVGAVQ